MPFLVGCICALKKEPSIIFYSYSHFVTFLLYLVIIFIDDKISIGGWFKLTDISQQFPVLLKGLILHFLLAVFISVLYKRYFSIKDKLHGNLIDTPKK